MAVGISRIKSLYVATQSTWATDPDADGSDYRFVHARDFSPAPDFGEPIERELQDDTFDSSGIIPGAEGGAFSFKTELRGSGTAAASTVAAIHGEMGLSLLAQFGAVNLGTGTTFSAGWTTTSGDVAVATTINVGDIIYRLASAGVYEARAVTVKVGSTLTVAPAWSGTPANTDVCYAMANYRAASSGFGYEALCMKGDNGYEITCLGCIGNVKIESLSARKVPLLAFDYLIDDPDFASAKGSLAATTDAYPSAVVTRRAPFYYNGTATECAELSFDLGNDRKPIPSNGGAQGRSGWKVVGQSRIFSVKVQRDEAYLTAYQAKTTFPIFTFLDGGLGNMVAVYAPNCQIVVPPPAEEVEGQDWMTLTIRALQPAATTFAPVNLAIG